MIALYGFSTRRERTIFEKLMTISGIGPKLAVTILSGGSVEDLVGAIRRADLARLTAIPGVGRKTGERIILELKDKLQDFAEAQPKSSVEVDVLSALENLGYNRALAEGALRRAMNGDGEPAFEVLFKRSLQILTKG
jgi:Holliday junction DNA helicase RuvA